MDDKKSLKKFYDSVGEFYPEEEKVYRTLRGKLRKKFVLSWLKNQTGSLLEIGTNRGMYLQHYDGGARFGIDLSQTTLKQAHRDKLAHYVVADAERLHCFKAEGFDCILCSEMIEHCFHPEKVFLSMAHVLKPGGKALLTTPNYKGERPTWVNLGVMVGYGIKGDWNEKYFHTAYRPRELAEFAQRAGLCVIKTGTLEKEIKYAAKIPAAILLIGRYVNRWLKSPLFGQWNEDLFQTLSLFFYYVAHYTRLEKIVLPFIKEGVRSYIMMQRSSEKNVKSET